jgi:hypothetical protein
MWEVEMELVTVIAHEILTALFDIAGVFIFVGALCIAHHVAVWRACR